MSRRRLLFVASLAACGWLAVHVAAPLFAQPKSDAGAAGQDSAVSDLDARYAQAYLRLVEATLAKYQEVNRRRPNTIRSGVISALQQNVRDARDRVKLAEGDEKSDADIFVASAEADLKAAEESLRKASAANQQRPGVVGPEEVTRLKADIELAKIRVEKARHLASESPLSNVQFELEQLREDVQELRLIVALLRDRN